MTVSADCVLSRLTMGERLQDRRGKITHLARQGSMFASFCFLAPVSAAMTIPLLYRVTGMKSKTKESPVPLMRPGPLNCVNVALAGHIAPPLLARKLSASVATARRKTNQARGMMFEGRRLCFRAGLGSRNGWQGVLELVGPDASDDAAVFPGLFVGRWDHDRRLAGRIRLHGVRSEHLNDHQNGGQNEADH